MQSSTYRDIIDDKVAEWQSGLQKFEEFIESESADMKSELTQKKAQLKSAIDAAIVQLHKLDEQETVDNTMETKDNILKIFNSIDKDFPEVEGRTPFML